MLAMMQRNWIPHTLMVGMMVTLGNKLAVSLKTKTKKTQPPYNPATVL